MRNINKSVLFVLIVLVSFCNAQSIQQNQDYKFSEKDKQNYSGVYIIDDQGHEKKREIKFIKDRFYYIVNEEMHIPLKPVTKTKFNLYPSATYLEFKLTKDGGVKDVTITKGSGDIITGKKIK